MATQSPADHFGFLLEEMTDRTSAVTTIAPQRDPSHPCPTCHSIPARRDPSHPCPTCRSVTTHGPSEEPPKPPASAGTTGAGHETPSSSPSLAGMLDRPVFDAAQRHIHFRVLGQLPASLEIVVVVAFSDGSVHRYVPPAEALEALWTHRPADWYLPPGVPTATDVSLDLTYTAGGETKHDQVLAKSA